MSIQAVIETGGKQYRVQPGDILQVEKLAGDVGSALKFDKVLFALKGEDQVWLGKPYLSGATVDGEVVGQGRGDKILIIKMKRRKQYRRTQGHRQEYTQLIVTGVDTGAGEKAALSADDKKAALGKFQSHLAPKGLAQTPKTLGSRKRMAAARAAGATSAATTAAAPKAKAPTPEKATEKKAPRAKPAAKKD
jgi:large subunit ribosomal protein L21